MYVQMRIVGDGPDSIADGYHLKIHTARGGFAKIPARPIPQATSAVDVKLGIEPSNALHEKTPTTPIKRGAAVRGWLRFPIGNEIPESISGKGGRLAVVVSDYLGRRYRSKATFTGQRVMLDDTQDLEFFCPGLSAKP
jgi:hypothetical protein